MKTKVIVFVCCALLAASLPSACAPTPPPEPLLVDLVAQDIAFNHEEITAQVGQTIIITLSNEGSLDHTFTIGELGLSVEVQPREVKELTFVVPQAGNYEYICAIPGHLDAGMRGTLVITP